MQETSDYPYTLTIPAQGVVLRLGALGYGVLVFVWTSLEDNSVLPVATLGGGLGLLLVVLWVTNRFGKRRLTTRAAVLSAALAGAAAGLAAALGTAGLMLIKNGLHAHLFPDYPFGLISEILARAPVWALAGMLASVGLLLAWWAVKGKQFNAAA